MRVVLARRAILALLTVLVAGTGLVVPGVARAQQPSTLRLNVVSVADAGYPNARAVVNVDDNSGAAVDKLGASNFAVTIDGKPVSIVSADLASSQNLPLDVLLVIDVSGSMAGEPIARTKDAAKGFVSGLAPEDRVAILTLADDVTQVQDYTTDRPAVLAAIDGLVARGNTALYKATAAAALKAGASGASRRAVILLSDGAQDGVPLTITRDQATAGAAASGAPFFTIGEGKSIDRDYLHALADITKGSYLEAPDPKNLSEMYAGIGRLLRSQYAVTFEASSAAPGGSTLTVELRAETGSTTASATYKPGPDFAPTAITIQGLTPAEKVNDARDITISGGPAEADRAAFYIDGVNVFETKSRPFVYRYDPRGFSDGAHTLKASVQVGARTVEASVDFSSVPPPPAKSGGGGLPLLPIVAVALALLVGVPGLFVLMRLRSMQKDGLLAADRIQPWAKIIPGTSPAAATDDGELELETPEEVGEPLGLLISRSGSDLGHEYTVGGSPISIGSGTRCGMRVDDQALAAEEARIWIRKGHLMVHKMTKLTTIVNEGTSGGWQILEPGDKFDIGEHVFEFRLLPAQAPQAASAAPNVLRDRESAGDPAPRTVPNPPQPRPSAFSQLMPKNDFGPTTE